MGKVLSWGRPASGLLLKVEESGFLGTEKEGGKGYQRALGGRGELNEKKKH